MVSRFTLAGINFGPDDYTITVAMACLIGFSALSTELAKHGLGKDLWTIPFDSITYILKIYFIDELLYLVVISMTKVSILFFYLRIFPDKDFRKIAYGVMGVTIAYMVAFLLVSAFQCIPVQAAWLHWDGSYHGACNNVNAQGWAAAAFNIVLDLCILILPLRQLSKLVMGWKKKAQLLLMFLVGGFVTVVSVLRLETLFHFSNSANFTWESAPFGYWSTVEMDVGIICACMPAVQALLKRIWPTVFGSTAGSKGTGKASTSGRSNPLDSNSNSKSGDTKDFVPLVEVGSVRDVEGGTDRH
ncbi:hypothetical protein GTA08_BOTSDO03810 [Botryosphaeria dothidea]|uniref:Rhodopsin domain-containing protein n=1 Tax=Botryosphaeria dothidea TaxID=55169 RepID=A0A8H4IWB2_9PEZI|nr:hypothetical protein GTA08_BOTSDO03810 [Botryosphaeria dothidea]